MFNYLLGEIYRMLRKKSMYIYFGCFAAGYALLAFIRSPDANGGSILSDAENLFMLLTTIVGGYLFAALYTDDLSSRNLSSLIGFGMSKTKIVLSKLILAALFGGAIFGLIPLYMSGVYVLLGHPPTAAILGSVYVYALYTFMIAFACAAVSAIVVYGLQRTTLGIVAYLLLSLGVVNQLISLFLSWDVVHNLLPGLGSHLMFAISGRVMTGIMSGEGVWTPSAEYVIYVTVASILAALAFRKKELEF
ncbi:MAG: hypothetical protein LBL09_01565 [Oscillospiraceae bacterium]|jgi:ABC-type transport system involved in multi-copper enzyme maturation permease subunit|nr:hypothetical protein [Oscillospiraceae bacterium]